MSHSLSGFHHNILPEKSLWARACMQTAYEFTQIDVLPGITSRLAILPALAAVSCALSGAVSYTLLICVEPVYLFTKGCPLQAFCSPFKNLAYAVRNLAFVAFAALFIPLGLFVPGAVYAHFRPPKTESLAKQLRDRVNFLTDRLGC